MTEPGLVALEARVRDDLGLLRLPAADWTAAAPDVEGEPVADVIVIGAGMYGLAAAGKLKLLGVGRIDIVDAAAAGDEGPWVTWARMATLRSPKDLPGLAFGLPSLTFRAWYVASRGDAAWNALYKIPNADWQAYLDWVRRQLGLEVRNGVRVTALEPAPTRVGVRFADGRRRWARQVVVATGRPGAGGFARPASIAADLWPDRAAHSSEAIDFDALAGRHVAVIGAGASAWDNAAAALEAGARRVTMYSRRPALPQLNKGRANANPGFFEGWHSLPDDQRWALAWYLDRIQAPPPHESVLRALRAGRFELVVGAPITAAARTADGVRISAEGHEPVEADFLILGTGFIADLAREPMFSGLADRILRWQDVYRPPPELESAALGRMPYLGGGFELAERDGRRDTGLDRIHIFNAAAYLSFGTLSLDVPSLGLAADRIGAALCRALFRDGFEPIFERLKDWEVEHELQSTPYYAPDWVNRLP